MISCRMFKRAVQQGRREAHGATNKERYVCARRRDGEPTVSCVAGIKGSGVFIALLMNLYDSTAERDGAEASIRAPMSLCCWVIAADVDGSECLDTK